MLEKIEQIRKAVDCECYLPALSLALTLPDIGGQIEYPNEKKVGKRYKDWFDKYAKDYWEQREEKPEFDFSGKLCYELRCSFLHSGNTDVDNNCDFLFTTGQIGQINFHSRNPNSKIKPQLLFNLPELCLKLASAAEDYWNSKSDKSCFKDYSSLLCNVSIEQWENRFGIRIQNNNFNEFFPLR